MTQKNNLEDLARELSKSNTSKKIEIEYSHEKLRMTLNLMTGIEGYEDVSAVPEHDKFNISYFGLAPIAFGTFLRDNYSGEIKNSRVLRAFKNRIKKLRESENFVHFSPKKRESYIQQLDVTEQGDYEEVRKSFLFFLKAFNDKAKD